MTSATTGTPPTGAPGVGTFAAYCSQAVKIYGSGDTEVRALDGVSIGFERGRFTAIMGASGSGKSTLMHCMAGLDNLSAGNTYIGEVDLTQLNERSLTQLRATKVGFIFQAFNLVPTLSALENITLPLTLAKRTPDRGWLDAVIDAVGLRQRLKHRPNELSGGQQQRVAVARALASRPEIIFADEPTGNLDSNTSREILSFMRRATTEYGQTIVMVTHDPGAASYANRAVLLADGQVRGEIHDPSPETVLNSMRTLGG